MSVTISATPILIYAAVGAISSIAQILKETSNNNYKNNTSNTTLNLHIEENNKLFTSEFETTIVSKEVLVKTLLEHGVINLKEESSLGNISCDCDNFHLVFTKSSESSTYFMKISYNEKQGLNEIVNNIQNEYAVNAQEYLYNIIKEKLDSQNLNIDKEEILDDDTIVLTVDLE